MKRFLAALLISASYGAAATAQTCFTPPEKQAFDVIALKSALMVGALSCGASPQYDRFMVTFQPYILAEQNLMDHYFERMGGLAGQADEDSYVTQMANNQSQSADLQGAKLCAGTQQVFAAVLALKSAPDLAHFVAGDGLPELMAMRICPPAETVPAITPPVTVAIARRAPQATVHAELLPPPHQLAVAPPLGPKIRMAARDKQIKRAARKPEPVPTPMMLTQEL